MKNTDINTKDYILKATFKLLSEENADIITIRKIAKYAKVAVSAVNYHFQTKENLIEMAVNFGIENRVKEFLELYKQKKGLPVNKLKYILDKTLEFIVDNPNISMLSILNDLKRGYGDDNISQSIKALQYILNDIFDGIKYPEKTEKEILIIAYQISSSIQFGFLRSQQLKIEANLDLTSDIDRAQYIDKIIDNLIKENKM